MNDQKEKLKKLKNFLYEKDVDRSVDPSINRNRPDTGSYCQYQGEPLNTDFSWNKADMGDNWVQPTDTKEIPDINRARGPLGKYKQHQGQPLSTDSSQKGLQYSKEYYSDSNQSFKNYLNSQDNNIQDINQPQGLRGDYNQTQGVPGSADEFDYYDISSTRINKDNYDEVTPNPLRHSEIDNDFSHHNNDDDIIDVDNPDSYEEVDSEENEQENVLYYMENILGNNLSGKSSDEIYQLVMDAFEKNKINLYGEFGKYFDYLTRNNIAILISKKYGVDEKSDYDDRLEECVKIFKEELKKNLVMKNIDVKDKKSMKESINKNKKQFCKKYKIYEYDFYKKFNEINKKPLNKWINEDGKKYYFKGTL